ncbi:MAG: hypothetical protein K6G27_05560 [Lachnospiraceae bacterium]|nr:hypothetical protein [Lachnospiraceae bacterium]
MKKTAVIFPGVGYTKDRPLLYYSGKLAVKYGYELKHLDFTGLDWSKEKLKDKGFLNEALNRCLDITDKELNNSDCFKKRDVIFISKSIGTVVATAYAKKHSVKAVQICFSPLEMIEDYVDVSGAYLFCGDNDPYADYGLIEKIADKKTLAIYRIEGGNHSLETGDIHKDINNIGYIIGCVEQILNKQDISEC